VPRPLRIKPPLHIHQPNQLIEPPIRHNDIIVHQHQILPARQPQPLVDRRRKTEVRGIGDHRHRHGRHVANSGQIGRGIIRRPVIDNDQLPRRPRVAFECSDALLSKFELAAARNDNRRQAADCAGVAHR
jgi:hypothetical protein